MFGSTLESILTFSFLFVSLSILYFIGRPNSKLNLFFFKKGTRPDEKTLKLFRRLSIIGILVVAVCLILSRIFLVLGQK